MTSIGDSLRRERQSRNLELPKIAGELKISVRFLEAIEQDEYRKLPGGVFTRSFVRQYANFLGLDGDDFAAQVQRELEPRVDLVQVPDKTKPDVPGIAVQMMENSWQSVRGHRKTLPSWLRAGVLLVVLMFICSGVYYWAEQRSRRPVLAHDSPPPKPIVVPAPVAAAPAPPVATPTPAGTPATTPAPAATSEIPVAPANPNASVRVGITADEAVWVRADVNGKYQFSGTLQPHESRNIDADGEVVLRLGNAGGVTITLNGKPVGSVGPKGQIRTVQFTSGGVSKVLDPLDRL